MRKKEKEIRFIEAVMLDNQRGIAEYYHGARSSILPAMLSQFGNQLNRCDIIDAFNDSFLKVAQFYIKNEKCKVVNGNIEGLRESSFRNIMSTITRNSLIDAIRNGQKVEQKLKSFLQNLFSGEEGRLDSSSTQNWEFYRMERIEKTREALFSLSKSCQNILASQIFLGMTYKEISEDQESTTGTVGVQRGRCIKQLKVKLSKLLRAPQF